MLKLRKAPNTEYRKANLDANLWFIKCHIPSHLNDKDVGQGPLCRSDSSDHPQEYSKPSNAFLQSWQNESTGNRQRIRVKR